MDKMKILNSISEYNSLEKQVIKMYDKLKEKEESNHLLKLITVKHNTLFYTPEFNRIHENKPMNIRLSDYFYELEEALKKYN